MRSRRPRAKLFVLRQVRVQVRFQPQRKPNWLSEAQNHLGLTATLRSRGSIYFRRLGVRRATYSIESTLSPSVCRTLASHGSLGSKGVFARRRGDASYVQKISQKEEEEKEGNGRELVSRTREGELVCTTFDSPRRRGIITSCRTCPGCSRRRAW